QLTRWWQTLSADTIGEPARVGRHVHAGVMHTLRHWSGSCGPAAAVRLRTVHMRQGRSRHRIRASVGQTTWQRSPGLTKSIEEAKPQLNAGRTPRRLKVFSA